MPTNLEVIIYDFQLIYNVRTAHAVKITDFITFPLQFSIKIRESKAFFTLFFFSKSHSALNKKR